jgi:hypothetical protein
MNNMKMTTEMNNNAEINSATQTPGPNRSAKALKAMVIMLSLTALCLSYRAASEAMALYGVLENVQATLAQEQSIQAQAASGRQISETKHALAGL